MVDPLSIAGVAAGLTRAAWAGGQGLWSFVDGNLTVNDNIRMLHGEAEALERNSQELEKLLRSPELAFFQTPELWDDASEALKSCKVPLDELQRVVKKLQASKSDKWTAKDVVRVIKKSFKDDTIDRLRSQLHSHNLRLVGVQGRLNLVLSSKGFAEVLRAVDQLRLEVRMKSPLAQGESLPPENGRLLQTQAILNMPQAKGTGETSSGTNSPPKDTKNTTFQPQAWKKTKEKALREPERWAETWKITVEDVIAIFRDSYTELHWAVRAGDLGEVQYFLSHGHSINETGPGTTYNRRETPLHIAIYLLKVEIALWLISQGADVTSQTVDERTPVHLASFRGMRNVVASLIDHDANVDLKDVDGNTPLHEACRNGNLEVVLSLISAGANVDSVNSEATSTLHLAAFYNHPEVIKYLISKGAKTEAQDMHKLTPLHLAAQKNAVDAMEALLRHAADVEARDHDKRTALHHAAYFSACKPITLLLAHNANTEARDKFNDTPLHTACFFGKLEAARSLLDDLDHGVKPDQRAVERAAEKGHSDIVKLLFDYGIKPKDAIKSATTEDVKKRIKQAAIEYLED